METFVQQLSTTHQATHSMMMIPESQSLLQKVLDPSNLLKSLFALYGQSTMIEIDFTKTIVEEDWVLHYRPAWNFSQLLAVFLWAATGVLNILFTFFVLVFWRTSFLDYPLFVFTASLHGYNLLAFVNVFFDYRGKEARAQYFNASLIGAIAPIIMWPVFMVFYFFHTLIRIDWYPSPQYATIKLFLMFLYNVINGFIALECLFPMYEWWQTLD